MSAPLVRSEDSTRPHSGSHLDPRDHRVKGRDEELERRRGWNAQAAEVLEPAEGRTSYAVRNFTKLFFLYVVGKCPKVATFVFGRHLLLWLGRPRLEFTGADDADNGRYFWGPPAEEV